LNQTTENRVNVVPDRTMKSASPEMQHARACVCAFHTCHNMRASTALHQANRKAYTRGCSVVLATAATMLKSTLKIQACSQVMLTTYQGGINWNAARQANNGPPASIQVAALCVLCIAHTITKAATVPHYAYINNCFVKPMTVLYHAQETTKRTHTRHHHARPLYLATLSGKHA
jgi:hypothetical protein